MKKLICLGGVLVLMLTACGKQEGPAASSEDASEEEILLTIDGREVPDWRYFCWLDRAVKTMAERYDAAGLTPAWGGEAGQEAKAQALSDTALYAAVESMAAQYGVTLTEEERAALDASPWASLPAEQAAELTAVGGLYGKLCVLAGTEGSALAPSAEALSAFAGEAGYMTVERILVPAGEGAADRAAELFAQVNGGGEEAFTAAKAQSADTGGPRTFLPGEGTFDPALEEAAAALEPGQLSGILESAEGYSILRRLETDTAGLVIPWRDDQLRQAAKTAGIEAAVRYETLDMAAYAADLLGVATEKTTPASSS